MLSQEVQDYFENLLSEGIEKTQPLSGGDINEVYLLEAKRQKLVVKLNFAEKFPNMFTAEAKGLLELKQCNIFEIPEVIETGEISGLAFLMMGYISSIGMKPNFWEAFGQQLARLHAQTKPYFGFDEDNYIGSLMQHNKKCAFAAEFYISQRLEPQIQMAVQHGFSFPELETFYKNVADEIPNEVSSLVHGDLWSGNFIVNNEGMPCLIDPAIAYAPREMDIAMMHLFGGFDTSLFDTYNAIFPLEKDWKERMPIFQLYYLLVHLNLFGDSYYSKVLQVIKKYL